MSSASRRHLRTLWANLDLSEFGVANGALATLWFFAGAICIRRLVGGFVPPGSSALAVCASLSFTLAGLWLWSWTAPGREASAVDQRVQSFVTLLPGFLLGWSLLPAGSFAGIPLLMALTTTALCGINWYREALAISADLKALDERAAVLFPVETAENTPPSSVEPFDAEARCENAVADEPDGPVTMWMTRRCDVDGCDWLEGGTKVRFLAGQKLAVVHLGFFPSFALTPEIECEILDEGTFHIRPAAVYPYGARLEVQRPAPLEAAIVELGFSACAPLDELSPAA